MLKRHRLWPLSYDGTMVEALGFEPRVRARRRFHVGTESGNRTHMDAGSKPAAYPVCYLGVLRNREARDRHAAWHCLVEKVGIEPTEVCLQSRCLAGRHLPHVERARGIEPPRHGFVGHRPSIEHRAQRRAGESNATPRSGALRLANDDGHHGRVTLQFIYLFSFRRSWYRR